MFLFPFLLLPRGFMIFLCVFMVFTSVTILGGDPEGVEFGDIGRVRFSGILVRDRHIL